MMWKKAIALSCAFLAAGGLTGCGGTTGVPHREDKAAGASSETPMVKKDGKAIVVYFSATGNTKRAAEIIARTKGLDVWEIKPKEPYTDSDLDYRNDNSRVSREHQDRSLMPEIDGDVPGWDSYETVFLGYPIWWAKHRILCIILCGVMTFPESRSFLSAHRIPVVLETAMCC